MNTVHVNKFSHAAAGAPPTLITSWPGTLSLVGSSADCGCPGRLWCQYHGSLTYDDCPGTLGLVGSSADCGCPGRLWCRYHGSLTYVLKIHYRGCNTTLALFYDVLQATGSNRETRFPRFHYKSWGEMFSILKGRKRENEMENAENRLFI